MPLTCSFKISSTLKVKFCLTSKFFLRKHQDFRRKKNFPSRTKNELYVTLPSNISLISLENSHTSCSVWSSVSSSMVLWWTKYGRNIGIINHLLYGLRSHLLCRDKLIRALKQPPPPRQPQKTIGFLSKTTALLLRRETCYCDVLWRTWTYDGEFSFPFLNLDKLLKNSTPGKVGYIWQIERVQIQATKV